MVSKCHLWECDFDFFGRQESEGLILHGREVKLSWPWGGAGGDHWSSTGNERTRMKMGQEEKVEFKSARFAAMMSITAS